MSCNVDVLDAAARPTVEPECDREMPVTAASRPTTATEKQQSEASCEISCLLEIEEMLAAI